MGDLETKIRNVIKRVKEHYLKRRMIDKKNNCDTMWQGVKEFLGWKNGGAPNIIEAEGKSNRFGGSRNGRCG